MKKSTIWNIPEENSMHLNINLCVAMSQILQQAAAVEHCYSSNVSREKCVFSSGWEEDDTYQHCRSGQK